MHTVKMGDREVAVGKIVCIGRNYAAHARELGNPIPEQPVLFMKPASSLLQDGGTIRIPPYSQDCHHEIELAVLIGRPGRDIPRKQAMAHIDGYAVALDLTLRDVQTRQKERGLPWEIAKCFDTACPLGTFAPADQVAEPGNLRLELRVNGELRQAGTTADMLRPVDRLLAEISTYFSLEAGDIILTGTPAGVGPIQSGDRLEARIESVGLLSVTVA